MRGNIKSRGAHLHYRDGIVVEDCRHVFRRKFVGRVADEEARLAHSTVTDDDAPEDSEPLVRLRENLVPQQERKK